MLIKLNVEGEMRYLNGILYVVIIVTISMMLTVFVANKYSLIKNDARAIVIVDTKPISNKLSDYLQAHDFSDKKKTEIIKSYSATVKKLIHEYEENNNVFVLSKDAVLVPSKHDVTDAVFSQINIQKIEDGL